MKGQEFLEKINDIDDDIIEEASQAGKIRKIPVMKILAAVACVAVCAVAVVAVGGRMGMSKSDNSEKADVYNLAGEDKSGETVPECAGEAVEENTVQAYDDESAESQILYSANAAAESSTRSERDDVKEAPQGLTKPKKDGTSGYDGIPETSAESASERTGGDCDSYGGACIPAVPKNNIRVTGEKLTDAEAQAYFEENNAIIVSSLASSGVPANNITISEKGISHLCYDGSTMEYIELRQNFRDYLVYNDGELVAIITLWKENGKIYDSPAFGAPWFEDYDAFLKAHKGEKLIYIYAGNCELIIAPDNSCTNPLKGYDTSAYIEGIDNPYDYFYNEGAVYVP